MHASPEQSANTETPTQVLKPAPMQLLLFVNRRSSSREQIREIRAYLKELQADYEFDLQVADVSEQPYLAEHYKLVVTPALIKIHPEPRQTLSGNNLISQLTKWWPRWQLSVIDYLAQQDRGDTLPPPSLPTNYAAELLRLSDDIFELKQENERLQEQLAFKDRILAMLAHDLRNPLTAASIALETLELGHDPNKGWSSRFTPELIAQLIRHARTQTRDIDRLITDILQSARGTNTELQLNPHPVDLGELCQKIVEQFASRLEAKSQQLTTDIPSDLPKVYVDPEWIRQVVMNLLDNAVKYTPAGSKIDLTILHRTAQKIQVSISDNGPGIPQADQERIFEEHVRLQRDECKEGYGIGLAFCRRVIRAHYGQIWMDSAFTQGSCFHFTLPVYR